MNKYIDSEKLKAEIEKLLAKVENDELKAFAKKDAAGLLAATEKTIAYVKIKKLINSFQQDQETLELCSQVWWEDRGWIMIPPDVTLEGIDVLLKQVKKKLQKEQPEADGDDGKFVKILVRKELAEQFQRLGDEIVAGQSSFVGAINQQKSAD